MSIKLPEILPESDNEPENYFKSINSEETSPIEISPEINKKYYIIDNEIFTRYYPPASENVAKESSKEERDKKRINDPSYVYGEITFRSMAYIFEYLKINYKNIIDGNFYDLGSGSGKAVIAAALCYPFKKCIGIEILESLYNISNDMKEKFVSNIQSQSQNIINLFEGFDSFPQINFINNDFLNERLEKPSVVYICSTCFTEELLKKIGQKMNSECVKGSIIISLTKRVPGLSKDWEYKDCFRRKFSWGMATIYVHRKRL